MSYILKSWLTDKVVYVSGDLFYSEKDLWSDVSVMKCQFSGTYAEVIGGLK